MKLADARNVEESKGAVHGVTKFMDLTPEEFSAMYLGYKPSAEKPARIEVDVPPLADGEQASKDWTGYYTTPVKDQGERPAVRTAPNRRCLSTPMMFPMSHF